MLVSICSQIISIKDAALIGAHGNVQTGKSAAVVRFCFAKNIHGSCNCESNQTGEGACPWHNHYVLPELQMLDYIHYSWNLTFYHNLGVLKNITPKCSMQLSVASILHICCQQSSITGDSLNQLDFALFGSQLFCISNFCVKHYLFFTATWKQIFPSLRDIPRFIQESCEDRHDDSNIWL